MGSASIPVDLFNPGQVFACLGLVEAANVLRGSARGGFVWDDVASPRFHLWCAGDEDPVREVLGFLERAEVHALVPDGSDLDTRQWKVAVRSLTEGAPFPLPIPQRPATLPAALSSGDRAIVLDHWGDATRRDNVKFWAGSGGYPGAALLRDALEAARPAMLGAAADPFALSAPQSSSFRFDWRRDYIALQVGFSPNEHPSLVPRGYPLVEILAAIGLTNARPARVDPRNKLRYRYSVLQGSSLAPSLHRAALGCSPLPFATRSFRMILDWPGQENQARCITDVIEETRG